MPISPQQYIIRIGSFMQKMTKRQTYNNSFKNSSNKFNSSQPKGIISLVVMLTIFSTCLTHFTTNCQTTPSRICLTNSQTAVMIDIPYLLPSSRINCSDTFKYM